jgi:hypothetical protein
VPQTLLSWVKQHEINQGERKGVTVRVHSVQRTLS